MTGRAVAVESRGPAANRTPLAAALPLILGLPAYVALHLFEPRLAITWSYAHLHRRALLPWLGLVLLVGLPVLASRLWPRPWPARRPGEWRVRHAIAACAVLWLVLGIVGHYFPAQPFSIDVLYFATAVKTGTGENMRWYLLLWFFEGLGALVRPIASWLGVVRTMNALFAAIGFVGIGWAARALGDSRREVAAIALLAATAFGTLQLAFGYIDIYPFPLAVTALYCALGLGALGGRVHPLWPFLIAALAPFWYIGLLLITPSAVVVGFAAMRRPGGKRRVALAAAVAILAAGLATVPGFGWPFAWRAFLAQLAADSKAELGLSPTSSLLPLWFMLSPLHVREILHTLLLVDGVGWLLLLGPGLALAMRGWDMRATFLASIVAPYFAYVVTMDPIFGPYSDWDLFSYGAVATSLLGGYTFVRWGRDHPRVFPPLLGLALAAAGVHLLARLNALDVDMRAHLQESPYHMDVVPAVPPPGVRTRSD